MTIYEILSLAINFAILIIELLTSLPKKKKSE
ncbi:MAG: putative holin-like toxin [Treponema sp.]|nr:putative holin-like toxin [Treponema sp.]